MAYTGVTHQRRWRRCSLRETNLPFDGKKKKKKKKKQEKRRGKKANKLGQESFQGLDDEIGFLSPLSSHMDAINEMALILHTLSTLGYSTDGVYNRGTEFRAIRAEIQSWKIFEPAVRLSI